MLSPTVRPATLDDVDEIHAMIVELAEYERSADLVQATPDDLARALFSPAPPATALVGTVGETVAGFALYFVTYSTWAGVPGLYLEDLYVRPPARNAGLGRALLAELATIAVKRGYARVEWAVLDWNAPAIGFYDRLGARPQRQWTTYRLTGPALGALAPTNPRP